MKIIQPCVFTEEEFDKVIKHSERSGNATPAEVKQFFAKWGFTIYYGANKLIKIQDNFAVKIFDRKKNKEPIRRLPTNHRNPHTKERSVVSTP